MKILLLSGMGPVWPQGSAFWDSNMLKDTFINKETYHSGLKRNINMNDFYYMKDEEKIPLMRPRLEGEPHLTTAVLEDILNRCDCEYETLDLDNVWFEKREPNIENPDAIFLSTTFICNLRDLEIALKWIEKRFPNASVTLGGQYSNLKYQKIMEKFKNVNYVLRGDGEVSIPPLVKSLRGNLEEKEVPNLVWRDSDGNVEINNLEYLNLDDYPVADFKTKSTSVPYESMRGCAFACKFCSFPAASPKWRVKSAEKIMNDWSFYRKKGVKRIKAMDSAFTAPRKRTEKLLDMLKGKDIEWEAYSRADVIDSPEMVKKLEDANCRVLSIGFESLSDDTLKKMNKRVTAEQNRKANELLIKHSKNLDFRGSFIVGFPGETPEDYQKTHDFLVNDFEKQFHLSVFSLTDETMPIWKESDLYDLKVEDMDNPDYNWSHCGMNAEKARELHQKTLYDVRWKNEKGVATEWQLPYQLPLIPTLTANQNYRIEKLIERLAFVTVDFKDEPEKIDKITSDIVSELETFGIFIGREQNKYTEAEFKKVYENHEIDKNILSELTCKPKEKKEQVNDR